MFQRAGHWCETSTSSRGEWILELQGNVVVTGAEQSRLTCESLVYVGATSELNIPQHFTLTAQPGGKSPGEGNARIEFALLELTGDSLSAKIDEQSGQLQTARISLPVFNLPTGRVFVKDKTAANKKEISVQGTITAGLAELNLPQAPEGEDGSTDVASWDMTLSGGPVHGEFLVDTLPYAFDTASAQVHSDPESGTELDLNGNVSITTTSQVITADSLQVLPAPGKGFKIVAKHGFNSQFNMAELSGRTPMKLPEILQRTPKQ